MKKERREKKKTKKRADMVLARNVNIGFSVGIIFNASISLELRGGKKEKNPLLRLDIDGWFCVLPLMMMTKMIIMMMLAFLFCYWWKNNSRHAWNQTKLRLNVRSDKIWTWRNQTKSGLMILILTLFGDLSWIRTTLVRLFWLLGLSVKNLWANTRHIFSYGI